VLQVYRNYIQAGRVCWISYGEDYGKCVVIVDVRDMNTVLVDAPDFPRCQYPLKRLTLTRQVVPMLRGARTKTVLKAFKEHNVTATFEKSPAAQKFKKQATRANLTDFERFTVMVNRKRRSNYVRGNLRKALK
jgi:large subunit ribosomal protein L14e